MRVRSRRLAALHGTAAVCLAEVADVSLEPWAIRWVAYHLDHEEAVLGDRGALHARALSGAVRALRRELDGHRLGVLADLRRALVSAYRADKLERFVEALAAYAEEERTARGALARWGSVKDDETALLAMLDEARRDDVSAALIARASAACVTRGVPVPSSFRDRLAALRPQVDSAYVTFARAMLPREVAESLSPRPEWLDASVAASKPAPTSTLALAPAQLGVADPAGLALAALLDGTAPPAGLAATDCARALLGGALHAERAAPHLDAWLAAVLPASEDDRELLVRALKSELLRAWHAHGGDPVGWLEGQLASARSDYHGVLSRTADALAACADLVGDQIRAARVILDRAKVMEERRYATNVVRTVPRLALASAGDRVRMDGLLEEVLGLEASSIALANRDFVAFPLGLRSASLGDVPGWKRSLELLTNSWLRGEVIVQAPDSAFALTVVTEWLPMLAGNVLAFHRALRRIAVSRATIASTEEAFAWVEAARSDNPNLLTESIRAIAAAASKREDAPELASAVWLRYGAALCAFSPTMRRRVLGAVSPARFALHEPAWLTLNDGDSPPMTPRSLLGDVDLVTPLHRVLEENLAPDSLAALFVSVLTVAPTALEGCPRDLAERLTMKITEGRATRWSVLALLHLAAAVRQAGSTATAPLVARIGASAVHEIAWRLGTRPETLDGEEADVFAAVDAWPEILGFVATRPGVDARLASAIGHPHVAAGFRCRMTEFRQDLSRPSAMIEGLGRRVLMRLAIEFIAESFPPRGSVAEMRPISEWLASRAVAQYATVAEVALLEARVFGGSQP